jgi:hypothetical protein
MMQTTLTGVADVHAGALAYRFEALQNFDIFGAVSGIFWSFSFSHVHPSTN